MWLHTRHRAMNKVYIPQLHGYMVPLSPNFGWMGTEEPIAEGITETVIQEDITTDDAYSLVLRDIADQECLRPMELLVESLRDPSAQDDSADGNDLEDICKLVKEICKLCEAGLNEISEAKGDGHDRLLKET